MSKYQKAYICPYRTGGPVLGERFFVQFNPTEIAIEEAIGVSEAEEDGIGGELLRLLKGNTTGWQSPAAGASSRRNKRSTVLSVTLFFNTLYDLYQESYEDVRKYISRLYPFTNRQSEGKKDVEEIYFFWGSIAIAGILTRMTVHYTMFAPDGKPVRANVELTITGDYVGESSYGKTSLAGTGDAGGLGQGDRKLYMIDDPSMWRSLCGGLGNPRL